jgi:hypothetical protein
MRELLLAAVLITGLMTGLSGQLIAADGVLTAKVSKSCTLHIDVRRDARPACWRLQCQDQAKTKSVRKLGCDLSALHQISEVLVAPAGDYLAVASVGEGHPILEIALLKPLIAKGKFTAKCELNPYPGTIAPSGWRGRWLLFKSDVDLALKDTEQRANSIADDLRDYRVDPANCRVELASDKL